VPLTTATIIIVSGASLDHQLWRPAQPSCCTRSVAPLRVTEQMRITRGSPITLVSRGGGARTAPASARGQRGGLWPTRWG
jgi:hypothetical protein